MGCDGIALVLNDDTVWDKPVADAMAKGIPVISIDCDDTEGIKGNERLCFIGQDERNAWRMIAERLFQKGEKKASTSERPTWQNVIDWVKIAQEESERSVS
jgi:ABC-type sugar transport system substrate-binding protein